MRPALAGGWLSDLVWPLVLAALAELLLLRLLMRLGAVLPGSTTLADLYRALQVIGLGAANLASLLALGLLGGLAWRWLAVAGWPARLAGVGLLVAGLLQIGLLLMPATEAGLAVLVLTSLALAGLLLVIAGRPGWPVVVPLAMMMAAVYAAAGQPARPLGIELPAAALGYTLAEVLALLVPLAALAGWWPGWHWRPALLGLGLGLLVAVARLFSPWTTGLAAIWTVGFSLFLPAPVYALALGLVVYAGLTGRRPAAAGLLLLVLAGLKLDHGDYALLALVGLGLMATPPGLLAVGAGRDGEWASGRPARRGAAGRRPVRAEAQPVGAVVGRWSWKGWPGARQWRRRVASSSRAATSAGSPLTAPKSGAS
jgi:hypothetical protein